MRARYSPCQSSTLPETRIRYVDENTITINGNLREFDPLCVSWPKISEDTNGEIISAYRDGGGELHLTVRKFYRSNCSAWDTGKEQDFNADS
jgi:hypothetical protein